MVHVIVIVEIEAVVVASPVIGWGILVVCCIVHLLHAAAVLDEWQASCLRLESLAHGVRHSVVERSRIVEVYAVSVGKYVS